MADKPADKMASEDALDYTLQVRRRIVSTLTNEGGSIPSDNKDRDALLKTLDGIDRQALGKMRIGVLEEQGGAQKMVADALATLLGGGQLAGNNPFRTTATVVSEAPRLPADRPQLVKVYGETGVGIDSENYSSFMDMHRDKIEGDNSST